MSVLLFPNSTNGYRIFRCTGCGFDVRAARVPTSRVCVECEFWHEYGSYLAGARLRQPPHGLTPWPAGSTPAPRSHESAQPAKPVRHDRDGGLSHGDRIEPCWPSRRSRQAGWELPHYNCLPAGVEIRPVNPSRSPDNTRTAGATPAPCSSFVAEPARPVTAAIAGAIRESKEVRAVDRYSRGRSGLRPFTQTDRVYAYVTVALTVALAFAMLMVGG